MYNKITFFILFLLAFISVLYAESPIAQSTPTPYINGVDIISGESSNGPSSDIQSEYYIEGKNDVGSIEVNLCPGDFRIGRVKLQKSKEAHSSIEKTIARFFYFPGYTAVIDGFNHKRIYRYCESQFITAIEHYESKEGDYHLYRKERFFWEGSSPIDQKLISQTLEDGEGTIWSCCFYQYDEYDRLIQETLLGNLSGTNQNPIILDAKGRPQFNGVESYSVYYAYDQEDPSLIRMRREDNGLLTLYTYTPTQQCASKLIEEEGKIIARTFYFYDALGFLNKTIVDDGSSQEVHNLSGVANRQIVETEMGQTAHLAGQPLSVATKYLDLETGEEILLEKTVYHYSPEGQLSQQDFLDANHALRYSLHMQYDEKGKLISTIDSRGEKSEIPTDSSHYRYNDQQQRVALVDKYGNETQFVYDDFGRLIQTISPAVLNDQDSPFQPITKQDYDIANNVIAQQDGNGHVTRTRYNMLGKPIEVLYPDGSKESFIYNLDGSLKEQVNKQGLRTVFKRNCLGRILATEEYAQTGRCLNQTFYTYRGHQIVEMTDGKSYSTEFLYDKAGRQTGALQKTKDGIQRVEWSYDASGQQVETREWFGTSQDDFLVKIQERDSWQQITETRIQSASGQVQQRIKAPEKEKNSFIFTQEHSYLNNRQQYVLKKENIDANGLREIVLYDALGRVEMVEVLNTLGMKIKEVHFRYDANGNKVLERHTVLAQGRALRSYLISWCFDSMNRTISIRESFGSSQQKNTDYAYNLFGQIETVTQPDGTTLVHQYDDANRLVLFESTDRSFAYRYGYDDCNRLTLVEDLIHGSTISRTYNAFNQIIEEKLGDLSLKNQYDLTGRRIHLTLPDESGVAYRYNGTQLASVERLSAQQECLYRHRYDYQEESGRLSRFWLIGEIGSVDYGYDSKHRLASIQSPWWSENIPEGAFDNYNNLTALTIQDPAGTVPHFFKYADDHQLSAEEGAISHRYLHDSLYNRLECDQEHWEVNDLNQLLAAGKKTYTYDANGNRLSKTDSQESIHYEYDALNRLKRVIKDNQAAIEYCYDAFHRRLSRTLYAWNGDQSAWKLVEQEKFLYDGDREIGKVNQKGQIVELRVLGLGKGAEIGAAVAIELEGSLYAPIHDHAGSVRCLVDVKNKKAAEFYRYSAFGQEQIFNEQGEILEASLIGNPWRFSSKRVDAETELVYFGKRYYDPEAGRWMTPDPLFFYDTPNLYAFVKNSPMIHCDLYGLFSISSIWDSISSAAQVCFTFLKQVAERVRHYICEELRLPIKIRTALERIGKKLLGEKMYKFLGYHAEQTETGIYGKGEISNKVRVTFINGILNIRSDMMESLELISRSHGGINVHYIFRPTEGWMWDICRAAMIKMGFSTAGFRSSHAFLLAEKWRALIKEMGGVGNGGVIIHYAHSLGGTETDRARELLTLEEQKMIRVITFGSATMIRNEGFQNVTNYVSLSDGVCYLDPLGRIRNIFDPHCNIIFVGSYFSHFPFPFPILDHVFDGMSYRTVLQNLGQQFVKEFGEIST
jgi:RHS repeat-associated protein